jgi:hypothetical protein
MVPMCFEQAVVSIQLALRGDDYVAGGFAGAWPGEWQTSKSLLRDFVPPGIGLRQLPKAAYTPNGVM